METFLRHPTECSTYIEPPSIATSMQSLRLIHCVRTPRITLNSWRTCLIAEKTGQILAE